MKTKLSVIMLFLSVLILTIGCENKDNFITQPNSLNKNSENFYIKDMNGKIVKSIPPDLLTAIHQQLLNNNRKSDAANLFKTYDLNSGKINFKINSKNELSLITDWDPEVWKARAHVENDSWLGYVRQGETCGTTGQSLRLEAFVLSTDPISPPYERPSIRYEAHVENTGWQGWKTWDQIAGTTGQYLRVEAMRCYSVTSGYNIWYRAHVADLGWLSWVSNGQIAGTTGQERQMEAFQMYIYNY